MRQFFQFNLRFLQLLQAGLQVAHPIEDFLAFYQKLIPQTGQFLLIHGRPPYFLLKRIAREITN
jgi:hypothetical protein